MREEFRVNVLERVLVHHSLGTLLEKEGEKMTVGNDRVLPASVLSERGLSVAVYIYIYIRVHIYMCVCTLYAVCMYLIHAHYVCNTCTAKHFVGGKYARIYRK